MGYTTDFTGTIEVTPPMGPELVTFLTKFNETRRMHREKGPDYVDGTGFMGQDHEGDVIDYNHPPAGQPGLWCRWTPTPGGTGIEWDGGEKFYHAGEWMKYIINRYIAPKGHVCNGEIMAQGEDYDDRWILIVNNNEVFVAPGEISYGQAQGI